MKKNVLSIVIFFSILISMNVPAITPQDFFNKLNKDNMNLVDDFYDEKSEFIDPLVHLKNREQVKRYYKNQYEKVKSIHFDFSESIMQGETQVVMWKMTLQHPSLNGGESVTVDGISHFRFNPQNKKVVYHRDYFDMGVYVYENIPILGFLVRKSKHFMAAESLK